ncbi:type II toxin-antitoxin system RelE/ParE family toxin [Candidatus Woesearchaeota archaeon]|nr:type II toxin-antitoxin system RelE/ParE family toxin [Candidatus Woesearchaeota archaeon]
MLKALDNLDRKTAERIKFALRALEDDPFQPRSGADIKKLHGFEKPSLYRLRIGDYRALYFIVERQVKVTEIIRRGKGYEWLE